MTYLLTMTLISDRVQSARHLGKKKDKKLFFSSGKGTKRNHTHKTVNAIKGNAHQTGARGFNVYNNDRVVRIVAVIYTVSCNIIYNM